MELLTRVIFIPFHNPFLSPPVAPFPLTNPALLELSLKDPPHFSEKKNEPHWLKNTFFWGVGEHDAQ